MKKLSIILFALLVIFGTANMASAYTVYDSNISATAEADWKTAVGSWLTEDFNDATLNPEISVTTTVGSVGGGVWNDQVKLSPPQTTTFSFSPSIFAFGGNWDLTPLGPGTGIAVLADGNPVGEISNDYDGGFWGFVSDSNFTNVLLQAGSGTASPFNQETFTIENMVYNKVPEPAMLLLFGAGLLGLGLARKFKQ
jgi:hypothetical protein